MSDYLVLVNDIQHAERYIGEVHEGQLGTEEAGEKGRGIRNACAFLRQSGDQNGKNAVMKVKWRT